MLALTVSTTKRNDVALIGIVLLACGAAVLATGAGLPGRLVLAGGLWTDRAGDVRGGAPALARDRL